MSFCVGENPCTHYCFLNESMSNKQNTVHVFNRFKVCFFQEKYGSLKCLSGLHNSSDIFIQDCAVVQVPDTKPINNNK